MASERPKNMVLTLLPHKLAPSTYLRKASTGIKNSDIWLIFAVVWSPKQCIFKFQWPLRNLDLWLWKKQSYSWKTTKVPKPRFYTILPHKPAASNNLRKTSIRIVILLASKLFFWAGWSNAELWNFYDHYPTYTYQIQVYPKYAHLCEISQIR